MQRIFGTLACLAGIAATPSTGGWVVITVEEMPVFLEVGQPVTIVFTLRQHGMTLLADREPTVTLQAPGAGWLAHRERAVARAIGVGRYAATVTPRDTGMVEIVLDADFVRNRMRLLPIPVVGAGDQIATLPETQWGQQLFIGKGCVTCHMKEDDPEASARSNAQIGPDLTGRRLSAEYIAAKLADPARNRVRTDDFVVMPDLDLRDAEISALVRYLCTPLETASR